MPGPDALLQHCCGSIVGFDQRGSQRQRIGRLVVGRCVASIRPGPAADSIEAGKDGNRRHAPLERGRKHEWLESGTGLTAAADRPIECGPLVSRGPRRAPGHRRCPDRSRRAPPAARLSQTLEPVFDGAFGGVLQLGDERRLARASREDGRRRTVAETLPQVVLGIPVTGVASTPIRPHADGGLLGGALLASVMKPSSRMRASTTWLRAIAPVEIGPGR